MNSKSVREASFNLSGAGDGSHRLGFGCASLGSRIGALEGIGALINAYEAGVAWYDVAPAYGLGEAEALLGQFLVGRRDCVRVTTKVGVAPPRQLALMKRIYAVGRPALSLASGLRGAFRKLKATRTRHVSLNAGLVETSISQSLQRLRTDRADIYALHDPQPEDVLRDDILRALERARSRGQAVRIAVAGSAEACHAALGAPEVYDVLQMSVADFQTDRATFSKSGKTIVLHSVFGVGGALDAARKSGAASAAAGLLAQALAFNPNGPVLSSMFSPSHLAANLEAARAFTVEFRDLRRA